MNLLELLARYQFKSEPVIDPIREGHVADKHVIEADGSKYVLRVRPPVFSAANVLADHEFLAHLHAAGFPAPRPIPARDGKTVHSSPSGPWELLEYLPHDATLGEVGFAALIEDVAEFLGCFHRLSGAYPRAIAGKPTYVGSIPVSVEQKYFAAPLRRGLPHWLDIIEPDRERELGEVANILEKLRPQVLLHLVDTPQLVCHNDFFEPNILVTAGRLSGLVDFDFCLTTSHLVDVVEGLHGAVLESGGPDKHYWLREDGRLNLEAGREFVATYWQHSGLAVDPAAIEGLLQAKLASLSLYPGYLPQWAAGHAAELFRRTHRTLEFLSEHAGWASS